MNYNSIPQKINDFLIQRSDDMYCTACIQEYLCLKWWEQVQQVICTLAVTSYFKCDVGPCCICHKVTRVIQAQDKHARTPLGAGATRH
jgi:hypothetical protein